MRRQMKTSSWRDIKDFGRMYCYVTNIQTVRSGLEIFNMLFLHLCQFGVNLKSPAFERKNI